MKASFLSENILPIIPLLNKIITTRPQVPVLSNLYIEASARGLLLKATDLELGVEILIPAKIEEEGVVTVPGKEFVETITSLPLDKIVIEKSKDMAIVSCRGSRITFNTIPGGEFPSLYHQKGEVVGSFTKKEFLDVFSQLTFSVSQEETRPQLTGVFVDKKEGVVNFVSTDGYRMSLKRERKKSYLTEGLIIDVGLIQEVISLKSELDIKLMVNKKEGQILFEIGDVLLMGRMIEGQFPDYEKVLPQESKTEISFRRDEMLQNVKLAQVFAKDSSNIVTLHVEGGKVRLATRAQGIGEGEMVVECMVKGEDSSISFNIKYLFDVLKNISSEDIVLGINGPASPAIFEVKKSDFVHVIMPIQVD